MDFEDLIKQLLAKGDKYMIRSEEKIMVGTEPKRKHKKHRIQKKWIHRYGMIPVYEIKKCKKLDVTPELIVQFCHENNLPLPPSMLEITL